jgi:hypothetical protein
LKALVANELLQNEKESLEKKCKNLSAELLARMQEFTRLETEKQVCSSYFNVKGLWNLALKGVRYK